MLENLVVYCDMDGVLANFDAEPYAVERFKNEKGFFRKLKPIQDNLTGLMLLNILGAKIYILSASPNQRCDADKSKWLDEHADFIAKENRIFCRIGEKKADFIKEKGILFDDFGKNCKEWSDADMIAYKISDADTIMRYIHIILENV